MLKIKEITIKNFRSIVDQTIELDNMNIFVGLNDVGKSNVLKAMNLFFNGETDIDRAFDFDIDYSKLAKVRSRKAKEIIITIKIELPSSFVECSIVIWKKVWRSGDNGSTPFVDERMKYDGQKKISFGIKSKVPTALRKIKYIYVPAIKSVSIFRHLMGALYKSAFEQVDSDLIETSKKYSAAVQSYTKRLSDIVKEKVGIQSVLSMSENQMEVFKGLTFGTKDAQLNDIHLDHRGDGVKARHIPAILKFIEEQDVKASAKSISTTTIWGYEEPENGVEMLKCYELAEELRSYSQVIQILITTHSPAFYSQSTNSAVAVFSVNQDLIEGTAVKQIQGTREIDEVIGLLPVITPYINEQVSKIKQYELVISDNFLTDMNTIIVEGKTDKFYIENAIFQFSSLLHGMIESSKLRILTKSEGCGVTLLHDWVLAWCHSGFSSRLVALFDGDSAGENKIKQIRENSVYKSHKNKPVLECIEPSEAVIQLFAMDVSLPFSVEHLFPIEIWREASLKNLLVDRKIDELQKVLTKLLGCDDTINAIIEKLMVSQETKNFWIRKVLSGDPHDKDKFRKIVSGSSIEQSELYNGFRRTINIIEKRFSKS